MTVTKSKLLTDEKNKEIYICFKKERKKNERMKLIMTVINNNSIF